MQMPSNCEQFAASHQLPFNPPSPPRQYRAFPETSPGSAWGRHRSFIRLIFSANLRGRLWQKSHPDFLKIRLVFQGLARVSKNEAAAQRRSPRDMGGEPRGKHRMKFHEIAGAACRALTAMKGG